MIKPKPINHKKNWKKIIFVGGFCIFFQGVNKYVVKVTSIKNNKKFVKDIYLWFSNITSLTSSPLYLDKGLISLFEACCSIMWADQPVIRDITKIGV